MRLFSSSFSSWSPPSSSAWSSSSFSPALSLVVSSSVSSLGGAWVIAHTGMRSGANVNALSYAPLSPLKSQLFRCLSAYLADLKLFRRLRNFRMDSAFRSLSSSSDDSSFRLPLPVRVVVVATVNARWIGSFEDSLRTMLSPLRLNENTVPSNEPTRLTANSWAPERILYIAAGSIPNFLAASACEHAKTVNHFVFSRRLPSGPSVSRVTMPTSRSCLRLA